MSRKKISVADLLADDDFRREALLFSPVKGLTKALLAWGATHKTTWDAAGKAQSEHAIAEAAKADPDRQLKDMVEKAYDECNFRRAVRGHKTIVQIGDTPGVAAEMVYGTKRRPGSHWLSKDTSQHAITVRADWLTAVRDLLGGAYKGELVLDARCVGFWVTPTTLTGCAPVMRLTTVRQGRGTGLTEREFDVTIPPGAWPIPGVRHVEKRHYISREDMCSRLGIGADVPDCILRDALIDAGEEAKWSI